MNRYDDFVKKAYVTKFMIGLNILIFVYTYLIYGTTTDSRVLLLMGANVGELIVQFNQWYRLLTANFIHIGIAHLISNMFCLYSAGPILEALMGHFRFLILYLGAGVGGSLLSFAFNNSISAGASTAVLGIFGAYYILGYMHPESTYLKSRSNTIGTLIIFQFIMGIMTPGIDNWGHFGGALYGVLLTFILGTKWKSQNSKRDRFYALISLIIITMLVFCFGYLKYAR